MAWACLFDGAGARRNAQGEDLRFFCAITTTIFLIRKKKEWSVEWSGEEGGTMRTQNEKECKLWMIHNITICGEKELSKLRV